MINKFLTLIVISTSLLFSQTSTPDTLDYRSLVKVNLPEWIEMQELANSKVNINKFFIRSRTKLSHFNERDFDTTEYLKRNCCWNLFDVYSPDSTKIVNVLGYRYSISKNDNKIYISRDSPDTAIEFIDIKNNKFVQFGVTGTSGEYNDCFWVNDSIFIVAYTGETINMDYFETTFTVFNLKKNIRLTYASNVYFKREKLPSYLKLRYPECKIRE